jgi:hypothetical protein
MSVAGLNACGSERLRSLGISPAMEEGGTAMWTFQFRVKVEDTVCEQRGFVVP